MTYRYPHYYDELSEASKQTLEYQGGKMRPQEAEEFECDPLFNSYILLRRWDELAKETNKPVMDISIIKMKVMSILTATNSAK